MEKERTETLEKSSVSTESKDQSLQCKDGDVKNENESTYPERSQSPVSSCVSMKSNQSMDPPLRFNNAANVTKNRKLDVRRSDSPPDSCVSMKSDQSMDPPLRFKDGISQSLPSCVSMKSDQSMDPPLRFKDGIRKIKQRRLDSPPDSFVSIKSDQSMDPPLRFTKDGPSVDHRQLDQRRSDLPQASCVSMKSDLSMDPPLRFKDGIIAADNRQSLPSCVSMKSDQSMDPPLRFKDGILAPGIMQIEQRQLYCPPDSFVSMKSDQSMDPPLGFTKDGPSVDHRVNHQVTHKRNSGKIDCASETTQNIKDAAHGFERSAEVQEKLKSTLKDKFQCLCEGETKQGNPTLLNEIYTELYITESGDGDVNVEHEVRQIEAASRRTIQDDTPINCNDIFKLIPGQDRLIRTVLTKGVAGIGKTISVQKFILDWAEDNKNEDIRLIFPLPFRELNLLKDQKFSLKDLLHFTTGIQETDISELDGKMLFVFDGLDECRLSLDFQNNVTLSDVTKSSSVDVLLTNLIKGNLLPSALIWITSRPAAADLIPRDCVHRVTEVRGFNDPQKEEYFTKKIKDQTLAKSIITHLKSSKSLYIMCHIPVFCWISATVLEQLLSESEPGETPKTLTHMYTHFLIIQLNIKNQKAYEKKCNDDNMILKLGLLAFQQLVKGNLIFYEEDLMDCGIDVTEASVYSGLCTQIFKEELGLFKGKVYCFVHLSIQEHLAALYVHLLFTNDNINAFDHITEQSWFKKVSNWVGFGALTKMSLSNLHQRAVEEAMMSKNGHLDLFLRFFLGLSLDLSQNLIRKYLTPVQPSSHRKEETVNYIKKKIRENSAPEKFINLFHCLNELGDHSLTDEIQHYLTSGKIRETKLSPSQWSAVTFVLLTSTEEQEDFDLIRYDHNHGQSDDVFINLMPVVEASRSAKARLIKLTSKGCHALASALKSRISVLRFLELHSVDFPASGLKQLVSGLIHPHCKLEILCLDFCKLKEEDCAVLNDVLCCESSCLKNLSLPMNPLSNAGVKILCKGLSSPNCKVELLNLRSCRITEEGCEALASVLISNSSRLQKLNLSDNKFGDSGLVLLSAGLENQKCKLVNLWLDDCGISGEGCDAFASALKSNLRFLDLSGNELGDTHMETFCDGLNSSQCKMDTLKLYNCKLTEKICGSLASALSSLAFRLKELDLSSNQCLDSGVVHLCAGLQTSKLETLSLKNCGASRDCCAALASVLKSHQSELKELDLSFNRLGDTGVKQLCEGLRDEHCILETLNLSNCGVGEDACEALTSALNSNNSRLKSLDVDLNYISQSGKKLLTALTEDPCVSLEKLKCDED